MHSSFPTPEPSLVWEHFFELSKIPRPSKSEAAAIDFLQAWAEDRGFRSHRDTAGNLAVHVWKDNNCSDKSPIVLQCHVDIVAITARPMTHGADASKGLIPMVRGDLNPNEEANLIPNALGDWIQAPFSTLGADNGVGVAMMMAIAESNNCPVPLQLLFTVDEEEGMSGAAGLDVAALGLASRTMINIDTEDDREITIGSAGGRDANIRWTGAWRRLDRADEHASYTLSIKGLTGGHSGLEINRGRANAIRLIARLMHRMAKSNTFYLQTIHGGSRRNAIPDACEAAILFEPSLEEGFRAIVQACCVEWNRLYGGRDNKIVISLDRSPSVDSEITLSYSSTLELIRLLCGIPTGICEMTPELAILVESSCNLATIQQELSGETQIGCSIRGTTMEAINDVYDSINGVAGLAHASVELTTGYPGWKPRVNSPLLKNSVELYQNLFGEAPKVHACHAGLECGYLLEKMPDMEVISIGPTIKGNHAVGERVQISSVEKSFRYVNAILERLAGF